MDTDGLGDTTDTDGELIDDQVGGLRAGRLTAWEVELDSRSDFWAHDVGTDDGAASSEEATVHVVPDTDKGGRLNQQVRMSAIRESSGRGTCRGPSIFRGGSGVPARRASLPAAQTMRASFRGETLAEAPKKDTIQIEGNAYFPPGAVVSRLLRENATLYTCPWKGASQYYDAVFEVGVAHDVGWSYPEPPPSPIRAVGRDFSGYGAEMTTQLRRTPTRTEKEREMNDTKQSAEDLSILEQLNLEYIHSDQTNDVERFRELLAEDFIMQTEDVTGNRAEYLEYIAKPRPFKDLAVHDVNNRILGDIALIHARSTLTTLADGVEREALYTDTYQKREGTWVCVAACALEPVPVV